MSIPAAVVRWKAATMKAGYVTTDGLRMYYEVHGEGRPLVLLHGARAFADFVGVPRRYLVARRIAR
jgi:pimeloyl-ACP methyl ester carboxylesterase